MSALKVLKLTNCLLLILSLFLPYPSQAEWVDFDGAANAQEALNRILSASNQEKIFSAVENRYGFNKDIWRSAKRKVAAPRVEIFFDNTNPKPGEKVTAHAVPEFFKNDPQNLYYTWYLIHTKDGTPQTATNTISDGKKEAARLIAQGDYDPALDDQNYFNKGEDPDKDGWPAVDNNSYKNCLNADGSEDNPDCSFAPFGGADGVGGLNEKTTEKYSNADDYCRSLGNPSADQCNYYIDTGSEKIYTPTTYFYTLQDKQTNYYCEECRNSLTMPATDCSINRNKCCYTITNPDDPFYENFNINTGYCPSSYNSSYDSCYQAFGTCNQDDVSACISSEFNQCKINWAASHQSNNEEVVVGVSRCYKHKFGTNFEASGFRSEDDSGLDYPISCQHKWKDAPKYKSGSGNFSTGEEEYWKTNPFDPDTDGDGFPDEADVIGLGQDSFTWTYQAGDRVGVVVEGTSMIPTDEKNAYYKIMWGYLDVCDATKTELLADDQCEDSDDYGYGFLATKSPSEEFPEKKLEISLSFSPENPVADPTSDETIAEADQIDVISSLDNTTLNPNNLYYTWYIQREDTNSSTGWGPKLDIDNNFDALSPSSGMGASSFSFTPKKDFFSGVSGDVVKIKVTVAVSRTAEATETEKETLERKTPRRGYASVVIPINKNGIRLSLHKVNIKDGKAVIGEEICNEGLYKTLCPAVQGQMLAAKVKSSKYKVGNSKFSWSLNENIWNPPAGSEELFDDWNSTAVFFPVTGEEQEIENISVTATPEDKLQPVTGSRSITVVKPALFIKTADESVSWPMRFTVEKEDVKFAFEDIESQDTFEALADSLVSYRLEFVPDYLLAKDRLYTLIDWHFNGESLRTGNYTQNPLLAKITLKENDTQIDFPTDEQIGTYYSLGASIKKYWSEDEKNILNKAWGITPQTLSGENSITVVTVLAPEEESALTNPRQILAAIGTHLPHYLMYNLRLALTVLVMFFVSAGFYALSQKLSLVTEYEKK